MHDINTKNSCHIKKIRKYKNYYFCMALLCFILFGGEGAHAQNSRSSDYLIINRISACEFRLFSSWQSDESRMREMEARARANVQYYSRMIKETQIECRYMREMDAVRYRDHHLRDTLEWGTNMMCDATLNSYTNLLRDSQDRIERFRACAEFAARRARGMSEREAYNGVRWAR
jgi:cell division septum initiation protein DivIVA